MVTTQNAIRFVGKCKRGQYWVGQIDNKYAVLLIKGKSVFVDGCERFDDDMLAYDLALDRLAE